MSRPTPFIYRQYMRSEDWRAKKRQFFSHLRKLGIVYCASCERTPAQLKEADDYLTVHHKTYLNFQNEEMGDLELLCNTCHRRHHKKERKEKKKTKRVALGFRGARIRKRALLEDSLSV